MDAQSRLMELRGLFGDLEARGQRDEEAWKAVCKVFEAWPDDEDLEVAIDYAAEHMRAWDSWVRVPPETWQATRPGGEPRLRLATEVVLYDGDADVAALAGSRCVENLERLIVLGPMSNEGLAALAGSPHFARLTSIEVEESGDIDDAGLRTLATGPFRLEELLLRQNNGGVSDKGVKVLADDPAFEGLTALALDLANVTSKGLIRLMKTPRGHRLVSLALGDGIGLEAFAGWIHEHADELDLQELDLGDMWEVPGDIRDELAERYEMILE